MPLRDPNNAIVENMLIDTDSYLEKDTKLEISILFGQLKEISPPEEMGDDAVMALNGVGRKVYMKMD